MKRATLYSSSRSSMTGRATPTNHPDRLNNPDQAREASSAQGDSQPSRLPGRNFYTLHKRLLWVAAGGLCALVLLYTHVTITPTTRQITQQDINAAVLHTLETTTLPSPAAKAYEVIRPSVVRVRGLGPDKKGGEDTEKSVEHIAPQVSRLRVTPRVRSSSTAAMLASTAAFGRRTPHTSPARKTVCSKVT